jgi:polyisoprenoid-binding protein YceI
MALLFRSKIRQMNSPDQQTGWWFGLGFTFGLCVVTGFGYATPSELFSIHIDMECAYHAGVAMKRCLMFLAIVIVEVIGANESRAVGPTSVTSVVAAGGSAELMPTNTKIEFIVKQVGKTSIHRLGGFEKFKGEVSVDADKRALNAVSFEIMTDSLWTQVDDKLTEHLKSPDFFDVKEYPEIKFQSTKVVGQKVVGDLTLHGVTKSVSAPFRLKDAEGGKKLAAEFTIDRTEFGMTNDEDKMDKIVELVLVIGMKTVPAAATPRAKRP